MTLTSIDTLKSTWSTHLTLQQAPHHEYHLHTFHTNLVPTSSTPTLSTLSLKLCITTGVDSRASAASCSNQVWKVLKVW